MVTKQIFRFIPLAVRSGSASISPAPVCIRSRRPAGCPRPPNPATGDKGCGNKNPATKQLGADVVTDVVVK